MITSILMIEMIIDKLIIPKFTSLAQIAYLNSMFIYSVLYIASILEYFKAYPVLHV